MGQVASGGERGLLSVAFHPQYATNGFFYVYYTALNGDITVERFTTSADPEVATTTGSRVIITTAHPVGNHNGGLVAFGPDRMLWTAFGDGGGGGDPDRNGQNFNALLGSMLRLDVDGGNPYRIPPDNPFVGQAGRRGEIWAKGLRNPWRFAIDAPTGILYIADVGQNSGEEATPALTPPEDSTTAGTSWKEMTVILPGRAGVARQASLRRRSTTDARVERAP